MLYSPEDYARRHFLNVIPNNHCRIRCEECHGTGLAMNLKTGHRYGDIRCWYCLGSGYFLFDPKDFAAVNLANRPRRRR